MEIFLTLLLKLLPLYVLVGLGFIAGRYCGVGRESVANLAVFIVVPVVVFFYIATLEMTPVLLLIPVLTYAMTIIMALSFRVIARWVVGESESNLLASMAGTGNTGYFGIPLFLILFPPEELGFLVLGILGFILFEVTLKYYLIARGQFDARQSLQKLIRLPAIYAMTAGMIVAFLGIELPAMVGETVAHFRGAYVVLGMMIVGLGLSSVQKLRVDLKFTSLAFFARFIIWPVLILGVIWLDRQVLHLFGREIYQALTVLALVPLAANTVAYATQLKIHPEKVATAILLSTLFALFYIPLVLMFFGKMTGVF